MKKHPSRGRREEDGTDIITLFNKTELKLNDSVRNVQASRGQLQRFTATVEMKTGSSGVREVLQVSEVSGWRH